MEPTPSCAMLSSCYSPQPPTPSTSGCFTADDLPFFPSTPPATELEGILDACAQRLDKQAEEKILPTAVLPIDPSVLAVQGLDEKELPTVILPPSSLDMEELASNEDSVLPPTILLPAESAVHQPIGRVDLNTN